MDETEKFQSGNDGARWFQSWRDFYNSIRDLDKPCLAALNGVAAGSAFQAAMLTDVRVGHPGVRMGQAEINSGIPSVTGPMLMLPRIGLSRTIELTLTGRMMDAEECRAIGLIHYLVDRPEQVVSKTREVAETMAAKPPMAMRLTKERFRQVTQPAFDEAFENGGAYQAEAFAAGGHARVLCRARCPTQGARASAGQGLSGYAAYVRQGANDRVAGHRRWLRAAVRAPCCSHARAHLRPHRRTCIDLRCAGSALGNARRLALPQRSAAG
ncbi:MAG: enoyl-CoA hydratase/isomerase family protein [Hyphomicrobiaceae bacterium]